MSRIKHMSSEQRRKLAAYRDRYIELGLNTNRVTPEVFPLVREFYTKILHQQEPETILIMPTPLHAWVAEMMLEGTTQPREDYSERVRIREAVNEFLEGSLSPQVWDEVDYNDCWEIRHKISDSVTAVVNSEVWRKIEGQIDEQVCDFIITVVNSEVWGDVEERVRGSFVPAEKDMGRVMGWHNVRIKSTFHLPRMSGAWDVETIGF